ncbi:MAG: Fic family protein [Clostridia bacterium]|nr:Fic family protein [Clostridia bacterium]
MENNFSQIQELLRRKAELGARLNLIPYEGTPQVEKHGDKKYLYMRKRVASKLTSKYVDVYSDELYGMLLKMSRDSRELRKAIRAVDRELFSLGYVEGELSERVILNIEFARANMKYNIYSQAVLEGVATSFPQTEDIIENGKISGMTANDVQKILNLKHAWEFITDKDVVASTSNYYLLCHIAKLVNEGFFAEGGRIRGVPVTIGGTSYIPPLPIESVVKEQIEKTVNSSTDPIDTAINLCLYTMKTQIFNDGNKRAAVVFANHYLISNGAGMLVISEKDVLRFKRMLIAYYEDRDNGEIIEFLRNKCHKNF